MSTMHYSELATLAACERKWAYRYGLGSEEKGGDGAHLGTLLHVGTAQWLNGRGTDLPASWDAPSYSNDAKPGDVVTYRLSDFKPEIVDKARWLLGRYTAHYGSEPPSHWNVISTEQWLTAQTPWGTLAGTADAIVEIGGELWLFERKSYASKGRLDWVQVDPQLGVYDLLVEANFGKPAFGILFDGIYTYAWKPKQRSLSAIKDELLADGLHVLTGKRLTERAKEIQTSEPGTEREPWESFQREYVDLSDDHRKATSNYLSAAVQRRDNLLNSDFHPYAGTYEDGILATAIPNIGRQCGYCDFKSRCWSELGGVDPVEVEAEDEDSEPV